jgi:L-2-hydroxyglutarate oxidase LhgO
LERVPEELVPDHPGNVTIIGGGILGMATALALRDALPALPLCILEKEADVGRHQTGHNSGVIHAGLYYKPGSLKATLCAEGRTRMEAFCDAHGVRRERCGKLVVATERAELPRLESLRERAIANGLAAESLDPAGIRAREPHAAGIAGLWVPETGVVDFGEVARAMRAELDARSIEVRGSHAVTGVRHETRGLILETSAGDVATGFALNCAGLHSDRVARRFGLDAGVRIVPFRGEYYHLSSDAAARVRGLIYPVPNPELPFLGVHLTRGIHGRVEAGPNAVLAFAREGYRRGDISVTDLADLATFPVSGA